MNLETEVSDNYQLGIQNSIRNNAPEKSQLVLKYLYMGIVDGEILSHESVRTQVLEDSRKLAKITDFSEDNICEVMYNGDIEQMDFDYNEAVQIQDILDDLV
ncbi:hypothetical protein HYT56_05905 [Candidatus Woesearchaeota archaeon]|nr:hypothetical protein [Candidatus Woesearchaeota archaeon]